MFSLTHNRLRWAIVGTLALIVVIVLTVKFDIFVDHSATSCIGEQSRTIGELSDETPLIQSFIPEKRHLTFIEYRIATYTEGEEPGQILFTLSDPERVVLLERIVPLSEVKDNAYLRFDTDLVLDRNTEYTVALRAIGARSDRPPVAWVSEASEGCQTDISIPGAYSGPEFQVNAQYGFSRINFPAYFVSLGMILLCVIAALTDLRFEEKGRKRAGWAVLFVMPAISFLIVEILNDFSFFGKNIQVYIVNYIFYLLIYLFSFWAINRLKISVIVANLLIYTIAVINYYKILFRGEPVQIWDIVTVRTAINVSGQYPLLLSSALVLTFLSLLMVGIVVAKIDFSAKNKRERVIGVLTTFALTIGLVAALFATDRYQITRLSFMQKLGITNNVWNQPANYSKNGFLLALTMNAQDLIAKTPEGYRADRISEIGQQMAQRKETLEGRAMIVPIARNAADIAFDGRGSAESVDRPNIIVIMCESYANLSDVANFETNIEYDEYINALSTDTIRGPLYVSTFGGGTANSEFEFLTGNSMAFLPGGSVPYLQYIDEKSGSLAWTLKGNGYSTLAVHPYLESGWSRPKVYERLGFDRFISVDDFDRPEYIREYISDRSSFDKVIELFENKGDSPVFIFNVTMQNHGGYGEIHENFSEDVRLSEYPDRFPETEQYLSLIRETDEAVNDLIDYFSRCDEPTIVLFFGDHLPGMKNGFYETILGEGMSDLSAATMQKLYRTEYFLWANFDIAEANNRSMSTNYLSTLLLETAGIEMSEYHLFLKELYGQYPVISTMGVIDSTGVRMDCISAIPDGDGKLRDYSYLIYNNLFGKKERATYIFDEPARTVPTAPDS